MTGRPPLPSSFRSVYRVFLRACSATVLHQNRSTTHLRLLWRPVFDGAAHMIRIHQNDADASKRAHIERWLSVWNRRVDETLELMYTSSQSRGLPHQVTKNLARLVLSEKRRQWKIENSYQVWNPKVEPTPTQVSKALKKSEKTRQNQAFAGNGLAALSEIIQMAEGRDGVSLGRLILKRRIRKL